MVPPQQKQPQKTFAHNASDDESNASSGPADAAAGTTGTRFFAARSTKPATVRSKWLAFQGSDSESSDGDNDDEDTGSDSEESDANTEQQEEAVDAQGNESDTNEHVRVSDGKRKGGAGAPTPSDGDDSVDGRSSKLGFLSDDDIEFSSASETDSSNEDESALGEADPAARRLKWLKDTHTDSPTAKTSKFPGEPSQAKQKKTRRVEEEEDGAESDAVDRRSKKWREEHGVKLLLGGNVESSNIITKLTEIMIARGKKGSDRDVITLALENLLAVATLVYQRAKILTSMISCYFDFTYGSSSVASQPTAQWKSAVARLIELLDLLEANPEVQFSEDVVEADDEDIRASVEAAILANSVPPIVILHGSIAAHVDRLDEEFAKSLASLDLQGPEFADRLRDEITIYTLFLRAENYLRSLDKDSESVVRIVARRVEHLYVHRMEVNDRLESFVYSKNERLRASTARPFKELVKALYAARSDRIRTRALLYQVYQHALHDRYHEARDMLLMSQLQNMICLADMSTQSLYNRCTVQLGLCAFRLGMMPEARAALHEICNSVHVRELLNNGHAGVSNIELLDAVYLTSSMVTDIPLIAADVADVGRRRTFTRTFRRVFENFERAAYQGPPENSRDHILAAAKALLHGDLALANHFIAGVRVWAQFPDPEGIRGIISRLMQEAALTTWLQLCGGHADVVNLEHLAKQFDLPLGRTTAYAARLIATGALQGKIDGVQNALLLTGPRSRVQILSAQLAVKLLGVSENQAKLFEAAQAQSAKKAEMMENDFIGVSN